MADRICEACEKKIGESDKTCPACGVDLETLEEEIKVVERANTIAAKRKAKATPAPEPETQPVAKKKSIFSNLVKE